MCLTVTKRFKRHRIISKSCKSDDHPINKRGKFLQVSENDHVLLIWASNHWASLTCADITHTPKTPKSMDEYILEQINLNHLYCKTFYGRQVCFYCFINPTRHKIRSIKPSSSFLRKAMIEAHIRV